MMSLAFKKINLYFLFLCLLLLEYFLFRGYLFREIIHYYPFGFDQAVYLLTIYNLYENILNHGLVMGVAHTPMLATGILFPIQSSLFFLVFGAARYNALLLNFIYFVILQISVVWAARSIASKIYIPVMLLGLLLCVKTPFFGAGGIVDFRMDFIAFCLYGIFVSCVITSKIFLERKWSIVAALIASLLILTRSLTVTYVGLTLMAFLVYLLFSKYCAEKGGVRHLQQKNRLYNLLLVSFVLIVLVVPLLWLNKLGIYNYYVGNHLFGSEKYIRAAEVGATGFFSALTFYPRSILFVHIGVVALSLGFLMLVVTGIQSRLAISAKNNLEDQQNIRSFVEFSDGCVFIVLSILMPLLMLTADVSKSSVVGSIVVVPCLWLLVWLSNYFDQKRLDEELGSDKLLYLLAIVILMFGLYNQFHFLTHHRQAARKHDLVEINKMYNDIGNYAVVKSWPQTRLSVDHISDYLTNDGIADLYFEQHGKLLNIVIEPLGSSIFAINKSKALASLKESNVVILNMHAYPGFSPYPFNVSINALQPSLQRVAEHEFKRLGDYPFKGSVYRVYVKG